MQVPYEQRILRRAGETWDAAGQPSAWAQYRQDMTDSVPWFKSQQSGVYLLPRTGPNRDTSQKVYIGYVLGLLIGGFAARRSYIDAEVVITSMNGSKAGTPASAETKRRRDGLEYTIRDDRLVGVIFGNGTAISSTNGTNQDQFQLLPCQSLQAGPGRNQQNCWLADYFIPTHMWPTRIKGQAGHVWMGRFEKFNLERMSWWANASHGQPPSNAQRNFSIVTPQELCSTCGKTSPRIYQEKFICVNVDCNDLWKHNGSIISEDERLTYTDSWLQQRRRPSNTQVTYPTQLCGPSLVPDFRTWWQTHYETHRINNTPLTAANFENRMNDLLTGFHCPNCDMLNRRVRWHEWHCRNTTCQFRWRGEPPIVSPQQALTFRASDSQGQQLGIHDPYSSFTSQRSEGDFDVREYDLGEGCRVAYLAPRTATKSLQSSDELFMNIQDLVNRGNIELERRWIHTKGGHTLTSHFSINYGEVYSFGVGTTSIPFNAADPTIQRALDLVNGWIAPWRTSQDDPANEMYIAGYMSGQQMGWHDDGEVGLQDIITTYTLGCGGRFKMSIKPKFNTPFTRPGGITTEDHVIVGCVKYNERRALQQRLSSGQITRDQWQSQFNHLMQGVKSQRTTILDLPVSHGCLVVMYGPNTQKLLEHSASVDTPMRFALTFRHITADHMTDEERANMVSRIAYDVGYEGGDPTVPQTLDPVRDGDDPEELPALSPRDVDDDNDNHDDGNDNDGDDHNGGPSNRGRRGTNNRASSRQPTSTPSRRVPTRPVRRSASPQAAAAARDQGTIADRRPRRATSSSTPAPPPRAPARRSVRNRKNPPK